MTKHEADNKTREERHRELVEHQLGQFPRELARCTCNTPSANRHEHANTCPLGPIPPASSDHAWPATYDLPEQRF